MVYQLYEPIDGLPFIGQSPINSQLYLATGFSGNGMTFGTLAAMLIADQILVPQEPLDATIRRQPHQTPGFCPAIYCP
uniref:FAD-dependent oxidoreductase n=1 Tax=Desertifilum tharense IPPAS B-1220 TaxID=1781255 RepID=A0ACD5H3C9_9CYAN